MTGYSASVSFASKELTARERIAIKDTTNAAYQGQHQCPHRP